MVEALVDSGVTVKVAPELLKKAQSAVPAAPEIVEATPKDFDTEFLALTLALGPVDGVQDAINPPAPTSEPTASTSTAPSPDPSTAKPSPTPTKQTSSAQPKPSATSSDAAPSTTERVADACAYHPEE